ncbi:alpha/beta fold hydrolase [Agaribacter marinus]|uniref:DUF5011 domain-containing protein n=1 Tax=Agaribacter marinus TaxID=1431249 RepID=A0AA37WLQ7_9ALTE|nr:alpha/beta fold hydrolase [Agaribacter marinus]GLR72904.1 hypothetical protein GCM10007852_38120 [Agaribacter marinus]
MHTKYQWFFLIVVLLVNACGSSDSPPPSNTQAPTTTAPMIPEPVVPEPIVPEPAVPETPEPSPPSNATNIPPIAAPGSEPDPMYTGLVNVSISLHAPNNTPLSDNIYMSGNIDEWAGGSNSDFSFQHLIDGHYALNFQTDAGNRIVFKFTRGNWRSVEVSPSGKDVVNRTIKLTDTDQDLVFTVENWKDLTPSLPNPEPGFWNTPTPDFSVNNERPEIRINGSITQRIAAGDIYEELGAQAIDSQDNDISAAISIHGEVNSSIAGDYLLRYRVTDNNGNDAIAKTRLVRVIDDVTQSYSVRPVGESNSHLGYIEQLPASYGEDADKKYPLFIYHHGGGGDASTINDTRFDTINAFAFGGGPATLASDGVWNNESQLITLSPQRSVLRNPSIERMNAFVDFAIANYQIDTNRIYMAGFSQGGLMAWRYALEYPNKVAAIVPIAGGFFNQAIPQNICDAAVVPVWAFHGLADNVINESIGRRAVEAINDCHPRQPARFTTFDGFGHQVSGHVITLDGFGKARRQDYPFNENLYLWMMAQSLTHR